MGKEYYEVTCAHLWMSYGSPEQCFDLDATVVQTDWFIQMQQTYIHIG